MRKQSQRGQATRPSRIILITDGQVGNEAAVLKRMRKADAAALPVHCFGIDNAVNDAFLKSLARQTGGRCALMTPKDDIPAAVHRLAQTLRRPVLIHLSLTPEGATWGEADAPAKLADLYAGEVTLLAVRCAKGAHTLSVQAQQPDGSSWTQEFPLVIKPSNDLPRLIWAQRRCSKLLTTQRKSEAIKLAIAHNLVCEGTSFVAWDDQEKVPVADREVYRPALHEEPAQLRYMACAAPAPAPAGGYMKRSKMGKLRMRSMQDSDASLAGAPPAGGSADPSPLVDYMSLECEPAAEVGSPGQAPDSEGGFLKQLGNRSGRLMRLALRRHQPWLAPLQQHLISLELAPDAAEAIVMILFRWANQASDAAARHEQIQQLTTKLQDSSSPLARLLAFVRVYLPAEQVQLIERSMTMRV